MHTTDDLEITRRDILKLGAATAAGTAIPFAARGAAGSEDAPVTSSVSLNVNGRTMRSRSTRARRCSMRCASTCN